MFKFLAEFEDDIENMENKIRIRLGEDPNESCWRLGWSSLAGRGVISTKDLKPGDTIFKDIPLVLGKLRFFIKVFKQKFNLYSNP